MSKPPTENRSLKLDFESTEWYSLMYVCKSILNVKPEDFCKQAVKTATIERIREVAGGKKKREGLGIMDWWINSTRTGIKRQKKPDEF